MNKELIISMRDELVGLEATLDLTLLAVTRSEMDEVKTESWKILVDSMSTRIDTLKAKLERLETKASRPFWKKLLDF